MIACATDPAELTAHFASCRGSSTSRRTAIRRRRSSRATGLRFDLRVVPPESFGNLLQHFTGSKDHNVAMREDAVRRGLSISEYGVTNIEDGQGLPAPDEDAVYEHLGYEPIPPELRENAGELEAARAGELPKLVEVETSAATCTRTRTGRPTARTRSRRCSRRR